MCFDLSAFDPSTDTAVPYITGNESLLVPIAVSQFGADVIYGFCL